MEKVIKNPEAIRDIAVNVLELHEYSEEAFVIITTDTKNKVTGVFQVSQGSLNASIVHPREVFKRALMQNSNAIFLVHNHPSGNTRPSSEDITITKRLIEAGELLGIKVLDHVIIGNDAHSYYSFKEYDII